MESKYMRIQCLMAFPLLALLLCPLCNALDFCGEVPKKTEPVVELSIDVSPDTWHTSFITVCRCPLCQFMKLSQGQGAVCQEAPSEIPVTSHEPSVQAPVSVSRDTQLPVPAVNTSTTLPDPEATEYTRISDSKDCRIVLYVQDGCDPCRRMKSELSRNFLGTLSVQYPLGGNLSGTGRSLKRFPTAEVFYKGSLLGVVDGYVPWPQLENALNSRVK